MSQRYANYYTMLISVHENVLYFYVENSVHQQPEKVENSGIGIENTRKRLKLIYEDKYKLDIDNSQQQFKVKLTIPV